MNLAFETTGYILRSIRKNHRLSQLELECKAGLCYGVISRIENGKVNPTKETLLKIIEVLELTGEESLELFGVKVLLERKL